MVRLDWMEEWLSIDLMLKTGFRVNAQIGPRLYDNEQREYIVGLMQKYPSSLTIEVLPEKYDNHWGIIGHHLYLDEPLKNMSQRKFTGFWNAASNLRNTVLDVFKEAEKTAIVADMDSIKNMDIYKT
jgi:hypothetical protein